MTDKEKEQNEEMGELTRSDIIDIIDSIKYYADENRALLLKHPKDEYYGTCNDVYYAVLDAIQNQLIMKDREPADYNLGENLDEKYLK